MEQGQELLRQVKPECEKVGLELNAKKTKVCAHDPSTTIKGKELAKVPSTLARAIVGHTCIAE